MNYLYNGVELPDINTVWTDKETYPYAHITRFDGGTYTIYNLKLSQLPAEGSADKNVTTPAPYMSFQIDSSNPDWVFKRASTTGESTAGTPLLWSNHDILRPDGTVYLAATDPIPVNPAPTLDPTSLLMGWQVGNRIRQRGNIPQIIITFDDQGNVSITGSIIIDDGEGNVTITSSGSVSITDDGNGNVVIAQRR